MANSFWKGFLLNQPPHTPYSAAAVLGIDSIFTFLTIYFEIQTGVTWVMHLKNQILDKIDTHQNKADVIIYLLKFK